MRRLYLLALLFITYCTATAQTQISGRLYFDNNTNGVYDAGDAPVAMQPISIINSNDMVTTNAQGYYTISADSGSSFSIKPENYNYTSFSPDSLNLVVSNVNDTIGNDFTFTPLQLATNIGVRITQLHAPRYSIGLKGLYLVDVYNKGTTDGAGRLKVNFNQLSYFSSTPNADSVVSNNVYWNFQNLKPSAHNYYYLEVNGNALLVGDSFDISASINVLNNQSQSNSSAINDTVSQWYEPNRKSVFPSTYTFDSYLYYTIRFANPSNVVVQDVFLKDIISPDLDLSTLEILSSSHDYSLSFIDNNLQVNYYGINLPPGSVNSMLSEGFFHFRIKVLDEPPLPTYIKNKAVIDFRAQFCTCQDDTVIQGYPIHYLGGGYGSLIVGVECDASSEGTPCNGTPIYVEDIDIVLAGCSGASPGGGVVHAIGSPPVQYTWSNGQTTDSLTGITIPGEYFVTVTDGCTYSTIVASAIVGINGNAGLTAQSFKADKCTGVNNGWAAVKPCGLGPFTYLWSNGSTDTLITNLSAGTYYCTITDAVGSQVVRSVNIQQSTLPTYHTSVESPYCFYAQAEVNVSPYPTPTGIVWEDGSTNNYINASQGVYYSFTINYGNNCQIHDSVYMPVPADIVSHSVISTIACTDSFLIKVHSNYQGYALLNGIYPSDHYDYGDDDYIWEFRVPDNSLYDFMMVWLSFGPLDPNHPNDDCMAFYEISTYEWDPDVILSTQLTNPTCAGSNNGAIAITFGSGNESITQCSWSNGVSVSGSNGLPGTSIQNLAAGTYTCTMKCMGGGTYVKSFQLTAPPVLNANLTASSVDTLCIGTVGTLATQVSGGTPPYAYTWSNGGTSASIGNATVGNYTCIVRDNKNCRDTVSTLVRQFPLPNYSIETENQFCSTTQAHVNFASPSIGSTYTWTHETTNAYNTAGMYHCTITDVNGCQIVDSTYLYSELSIPFNYTIEGIPCSDSFLIKVRNFYAPDTVYQVKIGVNNLGFISAVYDDGYYLHFRVPNISGNSQVDALLSYYPFGSPPYNDDCVATHAIQLSSGNYATFNVNSSNPTCAGANNGSITITDGLGDIASCIWSNGVNGPTLSNLSAGIYTCTITESPHGCTQIKIIQLTDPPVLQANLTASSVDTLCIGTVGTLATQVSGGTPPYAYTWSNSGTSASIGNATVGNYTCIVRDNKNCGDTVFASIAAYPLPATFVESVHNATCFNLNDAYINLSAIGGVSPLSYNWSNGVHAANNNTLTAGIYGYTVTDANGCTVSDTVLVSQPMAINVTVVEQPVHCQGGNTGSIALTVNGGTPSYTYLWSTGAADSLLTNISAGTYSYVVTDFNACSVQGTYVLQQAANLAANMLVEEPSCNGASNGSLQVVVTIGAAPYQYAWSNGSNNATAVNLATGNYVCTITDANGCVLIQDYILQQPAVLVVSAAVSDTLCYNAANGELTLSVSGGTSPYSYQPAQHALQLTAGSYYYSVIDANGCTASGEAYLYEHIGVSLNAVRNNEVPCGRANGRIKINEDSSIVSLQWSNGATTSELTNLTAGTYSVTFTDLNGCTGTESYTLSCITSVQDAAMGGISIYPNPTTDKVYIKFAAKAKYALRLIDVQGKNMYAASTETDTSIDLSTYVKGVYVLEITSENKIRQEKIIVE